MIELENIAVNAGAFSLRNIDLRVENRAYAVLMGPTGCGKTTLLETTCGLRRPAAGRIILDGTDVTGLPPAARGIGYVPQDLSLFGTQTVRQNMAYSLRLRKRPSKEVGARVAELAALLEIESLLDRFPAGLSGGEARRVALGRALAFRPTVLLLDEPLTGLDDATRNRMHDLLHSTWQATRVAVLHVTHNRDDAQRLATHRFSLNNGKVSFDGAAQ